MIYRCIGHDTRLLLAAFFFCCLPERDNVYKSGYDMKGDRAFWNNMKNCMLRAWYDKTQIVFPRNIIYRVDLRALCAASHVSSQALNSDGVSICVQQQQKKNRFENVIIAERVRRKGRNSHDKAQ